MSSTIVADSTDDKDDSLIIVVNADGTITVDPETLQRLIALGGRKKNESLVVVMNGDGTITVDPDKLLNFANNHNNHVSLVHVNETEPSREQQDDDASQINLTVEGFFPPDRAPSPNNSLLQDLTDGDGANDVTDPFSQMEPEHLARLESALQSEHAKEILGSKLDEDLSSMLSLLEGNDDVAAEESEPEDQQTYLSPSEVHVDHTYHVPTAPPSVRQQQPVGLNKIVPQMTLSRPPNRGPRVRGRASRGIRTIGGVQRTLVPGQLQTAVVTSSVPTKVAPTTKYILGPGGRPIPARMAQPMHGNRILTSFPQGVRTVSVPRVVGSPAPQAAPGTLVRTVVAPSGVRMTNPLGFRKIATLPASKPTSPVVSSGNTSPSPVVSSTTDQKPVVVLKQLQMTSPVCQTALNQVAQNTSNAGPTSVGNLALKSPPSTFPTKFTDRDDERLCNTCGQDFPNQKDLVECTLCHNIFHAACSRLKTLDNLSKLGRKRESWICGTCKDMKIQNSDSVLKEGMATRGGRSQQRGAVTRGGIVKRGCRTPGGSLRVGHPDLEESTLSPPGTPSKEFTPDKTLLVSTPSDDQQPNSSSPTDVDLSRVTVSPTIMALIQKKTPQVVLTKLEMPEDVGVVSGNTDATDALEKSSSPERQVEPDSVSELSTETAKATVEESSIPELTTTSPVEPTKNDESIAAPTAQQESLVVAASLPKAQITSQKATKGKAIETSSKSPVALKAKPALVENKVAKKKPEVKKSLPLAKKLETPLSPNRPKTPKAEVSVANKDKELTTPISHKPRGRTLSIDKLDAEEKEKEKEREKEKEKEREKEKEKEREKEKEKEKKKKEKAKLAATLPVVFGPELFSTPDIIRRVSTDKASNAETPEKDSQSTTYNSAQRTPTHEATKTDKLAVTPTELTASADEEMPVEPAAAPTTPVRVSNVLAVPVTPDGDHLSHVEVEVKSSADGSGEPLSSPISDLVPLEETPPALSQSSILRSPISGPKVEVQPVHPPISCPPILAAESLLDSIHAEVVKSDSALLADALLLDDLTNDDDDVNGLSKLEEKLQKVENPVKISLSNVSSPAQSQIASPTPKNNLTTPSDRMRKLPPIEVPTTRSATKKIVHDPPQTPKNSTKKTVQAKSAPTPKEPKKVTPVVEGRGSTESRRSLSTEKKPVGVLTAEGDVEDDEDAASEDANSEDDPDRLWCICKKPHNNRFMICCDSCEDWFHGHCVGVTKAKGKQMELQGVEWTCPNCSVKKIKEESNQQPSKIIKPPGPNQGTLGSLECVTCKKPARVANYFCSDDCMKSHTIRAIASLKKENLLVGGATPKVPVYNKITGVRLTGEKAPQLKLLMSWLMKNTGFLVMTPSIMNASKHNPEPKMGNQTTNSGKSTPNSKPADGVSKGDKTTPKQSEKLVKTSGSAGKIISERSPSTDSQKDRPLLKQSVLLPKVVKGEVKVGFGPKSAAAQKKIQLIQPQPLTQIQIDVNKPKNKKEEKSEENKKISKTATTPPVEKKKEEVRVKKEKKSKDLTVLTIIGPSSKQLSSPATPKTPSSNVPSSPISTPKEFYSSAPKEKTPTVEKPTEKTSPAPSAAKEEDKTREFVKKSLHESLMQRISQDPDINNPSDEVMLLVESMEGELFNLFNNSGAKYKAKYRTLVFNIKDAKNHTLYRKILEKAVSPNEIVRLTSEELANQELAQWREKEQKHQIEMIKKNELARIHENKVVVLKSRKGEEVIESKTHEASISELESALNRTADDYEEPVPVKKENDLSGVALSFIKDDKLEKKEEKKKDRERRKDRKKSHRSRSREKRSRSRSRGRRRSRSKSKERSKSSVDSKDHAKSKDRGRKRSRSKSKERSGKRGRSQSRGRSKTRGRSKSRPRSKSRGRSKSRSESKSKTRLRSKSRGRSKERSQSVTSMSVDPEVQEEVQGSMTPPPAFPEPWLAPSGDDDLADREPSSTVVIATPPTPEEKPAVWSGCLSMSEVTRLHATAFEVSGSCEDLEDELSDVLECVGRIQPDSVWEYVSRMKKAGTKDIIVIRFYAESEIEKINYMALYSYLSSRNRMAVIGQNFKTVKDFYVMPLPSHSPIPQVLLPLDGPGFEETRQHLLLGIIVRNRKGVYGSVPSYGGHSSSAVRKRSSISVLPPVLSNERSYTPPLPDGGSTPPYPAPIQKPVPPPLPSVSPEPEQEDDDNAPYDPGEGVEEDDVVPEATNSSRPELISELEELNKLIDEKKQTIEAISGIPGIGDTPIPYNTELRLRIEDEGAYSPSESFTPPAMTSDNSLPFSEIKLPPNLQEILANAKKAPMDPKLDPIVKAYTSQKNTNDELEESDDESEKSGSLASDSSRNKLRDPRQRAPIPNSLGQMSDMDLLRKVAEMEAAIPTPPPMPREPPVVLPPPMEPPVIHQANHYNVPPPLPPNYPPMGPMMGPYPPKGPPPGHPPVMGGHPPPLPMAGPPPPPMAGPRPPPMDCTRPPPIPGPPSGMIRPPRGMGGPPRQPFPPHMSMPPQPMNRPPPYEPTPMDHFDGPRGPPHRDIDLRGPGWLDHHGRPSGRHGGRRLAGNFHHDAHQTRSRNQPPNSRAIQNEWDEEIRKFEQRKARELERRKRVQSRSPSPPSRRHRRSRRSKSPISP